MAKNYYVSGDHNITCDVCSRKIKMSEAKLRWDGFLVCQEDFEMRHPQDFVRAKQDKISVRDSRPIPPLVFTDVVYICTPEGKTAVAFKAVAGCSIAGHTEGAIIYPESTAFAGMAIAGLAVAGNNSILN